MLLRLLCYFPLGSIVGNDAIRVNQVMTMLRDTLEVSLFKRSGRRYTYREEGSIYVLINAYNRLYDQFQYGRKDAATKAATVRVNADHIPGCILTSLHKLINDQEDLELGVIDHQTGDVNNNNQTQSNNHQTLSNHPSNASNPFSHSSLFPLRGRRGLTFIICNLPRILSFELRVKLFASRLERSKKDNSHQSSTLFHGNDRMDIQIRRKHLYMDAFYRLAPGKAPVSLFHKAFGLRVQFISSAGLVEAGIDGGGLSREFIQALTNSIFKSSLFFKRSPDHGLLYPNARPEIVLPHLEIHWEFIGRIMAKALYDGVLVEQQFTRFFLNRLLGRPVYIQELKELDFELHKSLMFLKTNKER